jgi:hypothetical protein
MALVSLSCWKRRWIIPTRTALIPSIRIVAVSIRTGGVASGCQPIGTILAGPAKSGETYRERAKLDQDLPDGAPAQPAIGFAAYSGGLRCDLSSPARGAPDPSASGH